MFEKICLGFLYQIKLLKSNDKIANLFHISIYFSLLQNL